MNFKQFLTNLIDAVEQQNWGWVTKNKSFRRRNLKHQTWG